MTFRHILQSSVALIGLVALTSAALTASVHPARAQNAAATPAIDNDDIGGVVRAPGGQPEAGVWVIAETTDLPTKFARIVVTDEQGRYVLPDLPVANYQIWVRGYGLVDSPKLRAKPGQQLNMMSVPAPNEAAAAHYYPAIYWYSMMKIPGQDQFGPNAKSGIPPVLTQIDYLKQMKNIGCVGCHQLGQEATRTIPAQFGSFKSGREAWMRRTQSGQAADFMVSPLAGAFAGVPYSYLGDWTDRVAKGELPKSKPPRPQGLERNIVVSSWEWSTPTKYLHDLISSDKRNPTVNAYGPLFGSPEYSTDNMPILDPKTNKVSVFKMPVRDANMPESLGPDHAAAIAPNAPSAYWGNDKLWDTRANNHNSMFGKDGRVWLSASVRGVDNPAYCKKGSAYPAAKVFPLDKSPRQAAVLDPKTMKYDFIDTCFATHHPQFGFDADNTLWFSGTGEVAGWVNTTVWDQTHDVQKAQGWSPFILDTNGNGKRDAYVEPDAPNDPAKDKRIVPGGDGPYAVMPHPTDGSIWYAVGVFGPSAGFARFDPKTGLTEVYNVPMPAFGIRGGDIDGNGVLWGSASSGHLVSFDRKKCKGPLNGPKATGDHCPEGWSMYQYPGPGFEGLGNNSAEASYYTWVDQHNVFGLGENIPVSTANLSDGFVALKDGKFVSIRIPYPMGFYAKGVDGRIDDAKAGWKGRGLWSTNGDRTPWLMETGKGSSPRAVHMQIRPDPLAH